ncbi:hypothetical protein K2P56_04975 [Patescibacteria group bacterium]|nr:hypothetical protein [Patescibacteria group bacterium]
MTQKYLPLISILGIVVLIVGFSTIRDLMSSGPLYDDAEPSAVLEYWTEQVRTRGAPEAYEDFKIKNARTEESLQHVYAHIIGEKIFEKEGVSGISVCDASFGFGCYHGFFGRALSEGGVETITELNSVCLEKFGPLGAGCQHGIGHGILEYVGYQDVTSALALCEKTTHVVPLLGCVSGVFMEFNTPLVSTGDGLTPSSRLYDLERPYMPCDEVDIRYKKSCYFELGGWTHAVFPSEYTSAADFCQNAPPPYAVECSRGFGAILLPSVRYDMQRSLDACDAFSDQNRIACRGGVAWAFYADPGQRNRTLAACEMKLPSDSAECLKFADLTEGQSNFPN